MSSAAAVEKRRGPLVWVLGGGVLFLILLFGGLAFLAWRSGTQQKALLDSPIGALRSYVQHRGDAEILEENPAAISIRFRDKKTGEEFISTMDTALKKIKTVAVQKDQASKAPEK